MQMQLGLYDRCLELASGNSSTAEPCLVSKNFQDFPSHRMFRYMHEALNVDGKKLITQFGRKS
jgi:hypothetical protein